VAGAICLILALFGMQTLPTNYAGLALIFLGIALFVAEANVPGFGLPTLGGVVCMILGSLILFESPYKIMRVSVMLAVSSSLATAGVTIFLVGAVVKAHKKRVISGKEGLIGEIGRSKTDISPGGEGRVRVHGETWDAVSETAIKKDDKIKVVKVEGLTLFIEKA
jgi:membrane-bound serine protease (ClpP class)